MTDSVDVTALLPAYRVLDLSSSMGAFCGKLLRDLGMDVIKIEPPSGDLSRAEPPFARGHSHREGSLRFAYVNAGKRSITLDISRPCGKELFLDLVARSDIVLETFEPGYVALHDLGYDILIERQRKLILVSLTGFGQDGPYAGFKAPDIVGTAMGGLLYISGDPKLVPCNPPETQSYYYASLFAAYGVYTILLTLGQSLRTTVVARLAEGDLWQELNRFLGSALLVGALFATGGLATAVYAIVEAPEVGWGATSTLVAFGVAAVLLTTFVVLQANRRDPLMRLSIFRTPNLAAANVVQLLLGAAWIPMWFFLNLYLQQVLGHGPFASGSALLPMTLLIMLGMITVAPRVIARYGPKTTAVAGLAILAASLVWLAQIRPTGNFWADVLPASLVAAAGMSLAFIPSLMTAVSSARPEEGGLASGIVNTNYQVGSALGLAIMTALAASRGASELGNVDALTDGFSAAFTGAAVTAAAGAVLAILTWRKVSTRQGV
jgi:hypothetical protein